MVPSGTSRTGNCADARSWGVPKALLKRAMPAPNPIIGKKELQKVEREQGSTGGCASLLFFCVLVCKTKILYRHGNVIVLDYVRGFQSTIGCKCVGKSVCIATWLKMC